MRFIRQKHSKQITFRFRMFGVYSLKGDIVTRIHTAYMHVEWTVDVKSGHFIHYYAITPCHHNNYSLILNRTCLLYYPCYLSCYSPAKHRTSHLISKDSRITEWRACVTSLLLVLIYAVFLINTGECVSSYSGIHIAIKETPLIILSQTMSKILYGLFNLHNIILIY